MTGGSPWIGGGFALAAAVVWAAVPVLYRRAVQTRTYSAVGALRCTGYVLCSGLYLLVTEGLPGFAPPPPLLLLQLSAAGIVWLVIGDLFYFGALDKLGVAVGVPVTCSFPLFVVLASWALLGERFGAGVFAAAAIIVAGLILLSPRAEDSTARDMKRGLLFAAGTIACWGAGVMSNKLLLTDLSVGRLEWWRSLAVTVAAWAVFAVADPKGLRELPRMRGGEWVELGIAGALSLAVGNMLYGASLRTIPVAVATCIASVRPFLAALFAVLVLRERLTLRTTGGIALVAGGVLLLSLA
jgi:DME family drug/metabolite transporter